MVNYIRQSVLKSSYYQEAILLLTEDTTLKKKKNRKALKKSPDYGKRYPVRRTMQQMTLLWIFRADKCCRMDTISLCMSDKSG